MSRRSFRREVAVWIRASMQMFRRNPSCTNAYELHGESKAEHLEIVMKQVKFFKCLCILLMMRRLLYLSYRRWR